MSSVVELGTQHSDRSCGNGSANFAEDTSQKTSRAMVQLARLCDKT